jgi:hypothetical protein
MNYLGVLEISNFKSTDGNIILHRHIGTGLLMHFWAVIKYRK